MRIVPLLVVLGLLLARPAVLLADAAAANKYLADAAALIEKGTQFYEDAGSKLDLAEASLDDVPAAEKTALEKKIADLRAKLSSGADAEQKQALERKLKRLMEDAEGAVGNTVTWSGISEQLNELLDDESTSKLLGADAVAAHKKQFATFSKVHAGKALKENLASAQQAVEQLEASWKEAKATLADADSSPNAKSSAMADTQRDIETLRARQLKNLPEDNAAVKSLLDRVAKISTELGGMAGESAVAERLEEIKRRIELYADEFEGMDKETAGPTWEQFRKESSESMSRLRAPATSRYISRMTDLLASLDENEDYKAVKDNAQVKSAVDAIRTKLAASQKKVKGFATAVVEEMEKSTIDRNSETAANSLRDSVRLTLGDDSEDAKALMARVDKKLEAYAAATTGAEEAAIAAYRKMSQDAAAAWPAMKAKFQTVDGFDPNDAASMKGKLIRIETDNLMGWRFKPTGDFPFATTLGGYAIAGRYDPKVKAAIDAVQAQMKRSLGDSDDDGKWEVIARVEGTKGRLVELVRSEGDVAVDGTKVGTVRATEEKPVEAPVITIIAARCGPLAVCVDGDGPRSDAAPQAPTPLAAAALVTPVSAVVAAPAAPGGTTTPPAATPPPAGGDAPAPAAAPAPAGGNVGYATTPAAAGNSTAARVIGILSSLLGLIVGVACLMKSNFGPLANNPTAANLTQRLGNNNIAYLGMVAIALGAFGVVWGFLTLLNSPVAGIISLLMSAAMVVAGFVCCSDVLQDRRVASPEIAAKLKGFAVPAGLACAVMSLIGLVRSIIP